ncbi:hypothetical protein Tco_0911931 [Tanacetum coccineum]
MSAKGEKINEEQSAIYRQNWEHFGLAGPLSSQDKKVAMVDGVFEGAFGALGDKSWFGNGSFSGCHGGLWWLIMDEEDDEVIVNIWKEFIGIE